MPDPLTDLVGGVIVDAIGGLFGGGGQSRYSAGDKRQILLEAANRYGTSSAVYQDLAKRWPKQARKVERYDLPGGPPAPPAPLNATPPAYFLSLPSARGYPRGEPPTLGQLETAGEIGLTITSFAGALRGLGKRLLAALLKRRFGKKAAQSAAEEATSLLKLERGQQLQRIHETARAQRNAELAKTAAKLGAGAGLGAGAAKILLKELGPLGKLAKAGKLKRLATAGTIAAGALVPQSSRVTSSGGAPTGSHTSGRPARPGIGQSETAKTAQRVQASGQALITAGGASGSPWWAQAAGLLGTLLPALLGSGSSSAGRRPLPEFPPVPAPQPGLGPLTGFGPGGVGSGRCECKPKRKQGKRKRRTICYTGRFTETATGTLKYDKRRRTTCQPSRKKPASQRAR